ATIDRLRKVTANHQEGYGYQRPGYGNASGAFTQNLNLVGNMIAAGFGTRVFYLSLGGFDTHANQQQQHQQLLQQVADGISGFFAQLERTGNAKRVLLMTFSEFG